MEWRFIDFEYADGFTNMAVDEAIAAAFGNRLIPPTLRLYGWRPPAVSIGYFQKLGNSVDVEMCKSLGIDVVRRLTGGRAVLHEHEVTYSVVVGEDYPGMPKSITESYRFICMGVINGLRRLGADVGLQSTKDKEGRENSPACFDAASMYEVLHEGKKLVGSAQVRKNGVILQHGSILVDIDIGKNIRVLTGRKESRPELDNIFRSRVVTLRQIVQADIQYSNISDSIFQGFENAFRINGTLGNLSTFEQDFVDSLVDKYKSSEWTNLR